MMGVGKNQLLRRHCLFCVTEMHVENEQFEQSEKASYGSVMISFLNEQVYYMCKERIVINGLPPVVVPRCHDRKLGMMLSTSCKRPEGCSR